MVFKSLAVPLRIEEDILGHVPQNHISHSSIVLKPGLTFPLGIDFVFVELNSAFILLECTGFETRELRGISKAPSGRSS